MHTDKNVEGNVLNETIHYYDFENDKISTDIKEFIRLVKLAALINEYPELRLSTRKSPDDIPIYYNCKKIDLFTINRRSKVLLFFLTSYDVQSANELLARVQNLEIAYSYAINKSHPEIIKVKEITINSSDDQTPDPDLKNFANLDVFRGNGLNQAKSIPAIHFPYCIFI